MRSDVASSPTAEKQLRTLATVALLGTSYFVAIIAAMHFLSPDISPVQRPTSEYATGPFGYLMTSAFVMLSVGSLALVIGLHRDLPRSGIHRAGLTFLGLWGVGLLVAASFPIDPEGAPETLAGTIHSINGPLTFLSLVIGTNLLSRGFKHDEDWRPIHRFTSVLAVLMVLEFFAGGFAAAQESGAGIAQRVLVATFATWFLVTSARLRSNATPAEDSFH